MCITFTIYLDTYYIYVHIKNNISRKTKISYDLEKERIVYKICLINFIKANTILGYFNRENQKIQ